MIHLLHYWASYIILHNLQKLEKLLHNLLYRLQFSERHFKGFIELTVDH